VHIRDHHQRAIDRLADTYRDDPRFRGLIIGGSIAKGYAREDSDVDFLIIATDEAFEGAFAAYSHVPNLDALLQRIPVYPEAGHDERIRAFYSMAFMQHWLLHEAERHGNRYTITRAASQLALFSCSSRFGISRTGASATSTRTPGS